MKKVLILSALLILCIGCTRIDNTDDYKVIIDDIIEENNISTNTASMGYKYYLPIGVKKVYDNKMEIGYHSYNHKSFKREKLEDIKEELQIIQERYEKIKKGIEENGYYKIKNK